MTMVKRRVQDVVSRACDVPSLRKCPGPGDEKACLLPVSGEVILTESIQLLKLGRRDGHLYL